MSLLKDKNFQTRALTGALFVGVIATMVFVNVYTFYILAIAINFLCLEELYSHTLEKEQRFFKWLALLNGMIPLVSIFICEIILNDMHLQKLAFTLFFTISFLLFFVQLYYKSEKPFNNTAFALLGYFYITGAMLLFILNVDGFYSHSRPAFAMLLFILVWVNDTGAYIAGSLFGKTRLFERISPKKSWEGTIGGLALCMIVAAPYGKFILNDTPLLYAGLGLTIGIFSTLGDLVESQLKRSLHIKDSGTFLPGHGGFLDRFDGFLLAMPAGYLFMLLFR